MAVAEGQRYKKQKRKFDPLPPMKSLVADDDMQRIALSIDVTGSGSLNATVEDMLFLIRLPILLQNAISESLIYWCYLFKTCRKTILMSILSSTNMQTIK